MYQAILAVKAKQGFEYAFFFCTPYWPHLNAHQHTVSLPIRTHNGPLYVLVSSG